MQINIVPLIQNNNKERQGDFWPVNLANVHGQSSRHDMTRHN